MAEASIKTKAKPAAGAAFDAPKFEAKFDVPTFDLPKIEVPAAFREFAEKGVSQAKESYEKIKAVAEEATDVIEETYSTASKGAADYGLKLIEAARTNTNATFDFYSDVLTAKSLSELIELSTAHARKQFETLSGQTKEFAALAQKVAAETTEPVKNGFSKAFHKVA
jgi:phasin